MSNPPIEKKRYLFWMHYLSGISSEIKTHCNRGPLPFRQLSDHTLKSTLNILILDLESILLPMLVGYLQEHKTKSSNSTSVYTELFQNPEQCIELLETYHSPTMALLYNRCRKFKRNFYLVTERIYSDWEKIKSLFQLDDSDTLSGMKLASGDEHGQGEQTSVFLFNNNQQGFVYKPVDLQIDILMHDLFAYINSDFSEKYETDLKIHAGQDTFDRYGYIGFCQYQGRTNNPKTAESVHDNYGKILYFGRFFKITDGHADNLIICKPNVIWLDLETSFHTFLSDIILDNVHELEKSGLLMHATDKNTFIGIVTGLQGGCIPRVKLTSPSVVNDGHDNMSLQYFGLREVKTMNRIYLHGKMCRPEQYSDAICRGYAKTMKLLIRNKDKLLEFINDRLENNVVRTRHLLLLTACYRRYSMLLNHFISFKENHLLATVRKERDALFATDEIAYKNFIFENEMTDICNDVIPYFYRKSNSCSLWHASGSSIENFFKKTLLEEIHDHFAKQSIDDIAADLQYINQALESTAGVTNWEIFKNKFNFPIYTHQPA